MDGWRIVLDFDRLCAVCEVEGAEGVLVELFGRRETEDWSTHVRSFDCHGQLTLRSLLSFRCSGPGLGCGSSLTLGMGSGSIESSIELPCDHQEVDTHHLLRHCLDAL